MSKKQRTLGLCLVLFVAVAAAFLPSLRNDFVSFDDGTYVTLNTHVQSGLTWGNVKWAFASSAGSNWHPLTWLSHMLDCQLYGLNAWGHHLTNLVLHALNSLLVFLLLRAMTGATWRSFFVAALFGLHPLRVESVAWVAERKDVLSTLFFLLTVWAYFQSKVQSPKSKIYARDGRAPTQLDPEPLARSYATRSARFYVLALGCFALGLMSKPMLVTLPFVLLLLDFWPLQRVQIPFPGTDSGKAASRSDSAPWRAWKNLLVEKLPFFVLAASSSVVTFLVQDRAGATLMLGQLSWPARLGNAVVSYWRYLGKTFWPTDLAVFYPHPGAWPIGIVLAAGLLLLAVTAAMLALSRRRPYLLVGWLWYLGTLVPVIGLVQVGRQAMADRYTYIPSLGILLILVWGAHALFCAREDAQSSKPSNGSSAAGTQALPPIPGLSLAVLATVLALACGILTFRQNGFWKDSETLFGHAIAVVPNNYLAHGNLGNAFERQGRLSEAFREYDEVLRILPDDVNTRNGLGSLLLTLGRMDEAIAQFQEAIRRMPQFAEGHNNLGYAYQRLGRMDQAKVEYRKALELNPKDFRVHINLAGVALAEGHTDEAIGELQTAVKLRPEEVATHNDLGGLLFNAGRLDEAIAEFESAIRLAPNSAEAHCNLGAALAGKGRIEEAVAQFTLALQLRPNYPEAEQRLRALTQPAPR